MHLKAAAIAGLCVWLQGCCCCSIPLDLVPDSTKEAIAQEAAEQAFEGVTGAEVDMDGGRFSIKTDEGSIVAGEGALGVDPRVPLAPYKDCAVQAGVTFSDGKSTTTGFSQEDCEASVQELDAWFTKQFESLGVKTTRSEMKSTDGSYLQIVGEGSGDKWTALSAAVASEKDGKRTVAVIMQISNP